MPSVCPLPAAAFGPAFSPLLRSANASWQSHGYSLRQIAMLLSQLNEMDLTASCYIKSVNVPESVKNIFKNRSAEHGKKANGRAESQRKIFLPSGFLRNFSSSHEGRFPAKLLQKAPESYRNPGQSAMGYADRKTMAALIGIFG